MIKHFRVHDRLRHDGVGWFLILLSLLIAGAGVILLVDRHLLLFFDLVAFANLPLYLANRRLKTRIIFRDAMRLARESAERVKEDVND